MLFSLLKHYLELYITDTALNVSQSLYCFTASIFHGVENYFPRLWGTGISDAIFTTEVVPKVFPNIIVVAHLVVPAGWGSCLPRLAIFYAVGKLHYDFIEQLPEGSVLIGCQCKELSQ